MDKQREAELFDHLSRDARVREWLEAQLQTQITVLVGHPDTTQLGRAQGVARFLQQVLEKLDRARPR